MSNSETRLLRKTISLLNSMIESGDKHDEYSKTFIEISGKSLDNIEKRLQNPLETIEEKL